MSELCARAMRNGQMSSGMPSAQLGARFQPRPRVVDVLGGASRRAAPASNAWREHGPPHLSDKSSSKGGPHDSRQASTRSGRPAPRRPCWIARMDHPAPSPRQRPGRSGSRASRRTVNACCSTNACGRPSGASVHGHRPRPEDGRRCKGLAVGAVVLPFYWRMPAVVVSSAPAT
jgi:hypothetical protein